MLLNALGRSAEAVPLLRRALELRPGFVEARANLGIAYLVQGEPQLALDTWQPLLTVDEPDTRVLELAGVARQMLRR